MSQILLLSNLIVAGFLAGLIWFVQVVHYPIFLRVPPAQFVAYHHAHTATTGSLVALPMVVELILSLLMTSQPLAGVPMWQHWTALGCVIAVWVLTFGWFVPMHGQLSEGFDALLIQRMVALNWLRTFFWSVRLALLAFMLWKFLEK